MFANHSVDALQRVLLVVATEDDCFINQPALLLGSPAPHITLVAPGRLRVDAAGYINNTVRNLAGVFFPAINQNIVLQLLAGHVAPEFAERRVMKRLFLERVAFRFQPLADNLAPSIEV